MRGGAGAVERSVEFLALRELVGVLAVLTRLLLAECLVGGSGDQRVERGLRWRAGGRRRQRELALFPLTASERGAAGQRHRQTTCPARIHTGCLRWSFAA